MNGKKRLSSSFLFTVLFFSFFLTVSLPQLTVPVAATELGTQGWTYRKSHTINSAAGAGTNYQIHIRCYYGAGGDNGDYVYLNGRARTDFGDVRFTDSSGNFLDYWLQKKEDSYYADFWVEVTADLTGQSATIYVYYGKSDATSSSNGADTFIFFGDFESQTGWTYEETNVGFNGFYDTAVFKYTPTTSYKLLLPLSTTTSAGQYCQIKRTITFDGSQVKIELNVKDSSTSTSGYHHKRIYLDDTQLWSVDCSDFVSGDGYGWLAVSVSTTPSSGNHDLKLRLHENQGVTNLPINVWWDDVRIRKYVNPEPSHGAWGAEEKYVSGSWQTSQLGWLQGWSYRKSHNVTGSTDGATQLSSQRLIRVDDAKLGNQ